MSSRNLLLLVIVVYLTIVTHVHAEAPLRLVQVDTDSTFGYSLDLQHLSQCSFALEILSPANLSSLTMPVDHEGTIPITIRFSIHSLGRDNDNNINNINNNNNNINNNDDDDEDIHQLPITESRYLQIITETCPIDAVNDFDIPPVPYAGASAYMVEGSERLLARNPCQQASVRTVSLHGIALGVGAHRITLLAVDQLGRRLLDVEVSRILISIDAHGNVAASSAATSSSSNVESGPFSTLRTKLDNRKREFSRLRARNQAFAAQYQPYRLHEALFDKSEVSRFVSEPYRQAIESNNVTAMLELVRAETATGIYSVPLVSDEFRTMLIEEVDNVDQSPVADSAPRPNSMNHYGVVLDDLGMYDSIQSLINNYIQPLTRVLYPEWGGDALDWHHAFVVEYALASKDEHLSYHVDQCEVTVNICLGRNFTGGSLYFRGVRDHSSSSATSTSTSTTASNTRLTKTSMGLLSSHRALPPPENFHFDHTLDRALFHVGQHWHGANKIVDGERYNLILWLRSSKYHQSIAEQLFEARRNRRLRSRQPPKSKGSDHTEL